MSSALACALAAAAAASFSTHDTPRPLDVVIQDDAVLLHGSPAEVDAAARQIAAIGADTVRLTAGWSAIAPSPRSRRRPRFDATDPAEYGGGGFIHLDRAVKASRRHGLDVMIDVAFWAPRWAVRRRAGTLSRQRWAPSPVEYGRFAEAVARRYSGSHPDPERRGRDLPRVVTYTTWNEPNHPSFLLPQWRKRRGKWRPASPHVYRRLHQTGRAAIKSVHSSNRVLVGGLAATGASRPGVRRAMAPLRFIREMACVDGALRPLRIPECRGYRPLEADGFSHHPYSFGMTPDASHPDPDAVPVGDLARLSALLEALAERGRIAGPLPLHLTEYGYETSPPDPRRGIPPEDQARFHSQATFLAWRRPDTRSFAQFLLRDLGPDPRLPERNARRWRTWQTGLLNEDGSAKPALQAFRLPFWLEAHDWSGQRFVIAFGQVRPGHGRHQVAIEALAPDGVWRTARSLEARSAGDHACDGEATEFLTDTHGFYLRVLPYQENITYRARWTRSDGTREYAVPVGAGTPRIGSAPG